MQLVPPTPQAGSAPINSNPAALAASVVVSGVQATLLRMSMLNTNAAIRYLQAFNAAAVPAEGAIPVLSVDVAAGAFRAIELGVYGKLFPKGIVLCTSSTPGVKTLGAADALLEATYTAG